MIPANQIFSSRLTLVLILSELRIKQWAYSAEHNKDSLFLPHISSDPFAPVLQINIATNHELLLIKSTPLLWIFLEY